MGYSITIGELRIEKNPDDGFDSPCIKFLANHIRKDDAPAFGEPTDYTNSRWPSYTSWTNAMREAGLYECFFSNGTLIGGHPGVRLVTEDLLLAVQNAKYCIEKANPGMKAQFDDSKPLQSTYCRVIWLEYWMSWALANCEVPVIANS